MIGHVPGEKETATGKNEYKLHMRNVYKLYIYIYAFDTIHIDGNEFSALYLLIIIIITVSFSFFFCLYVFVLVSFVCSLYRPRCVHVEIVWMYLMISFAAIEVNEL